MAREVFGRHRIAKDPDELKGISREKAIMLLDSDSG